MGEDLSQEFLAKEGFLAAVAVALARPKAQHCQRSSRFVTSDAPGPLPKGVGPHISIVGFMVGPPLLPGQEGLWLLSKELSENFHDPAT